MASVIACVEDLLFLSRIREAAAGAKVTVALEPAVLVAACRTLPAPLVLIDLDTARRDALAAVHALRAETDLGEVPIVGFVSHVDTTRATAAREAGVTRVLPRSAFVRELPGYPGGGRARYNRPRGQTDAMRRSR